MLALDFLANPSAQELDRMFTHTASSLAAKPFGSHERRHPAKDACPIRAESASTGKMPCPWYAKPKEWKGSRCTFRSLRMMGFVGRDRQKAAVVVFVGFFLFLTAHLYHDG
jgi:hypothetical protein